MDGSKMTPDLRKLVYDAFAKVPGTVFVKPDGEKLDRSKVLNASEAGRCLRQIVFGKASPEKVEGQFGKLESAGYAERGKNAEAWVNSLFRVHNETTLFSEGRFVFYGHEQRSFVYKNLSATPDGVFTRGTRSWNLDIKSLDPRTNRNYLPKNDHVVQVKQAAHILDHVSPFNIVGSIIFYIDASNYGDLWQKVIPRDPEFGAWIEDRANTALANTPPNKVKAEGLLTEKGCDFCPFTGDCSDAMQQTEVYLANLEAAERALKNV